MEFLMCVWNGGERQSNPQWCIAPISMVNVSCHNQEGGTGYHPLRTIGAQRSFTPSSIALLNRSLWYDGCVSCSLLWLYLSDRCHIHKENFQNDKKKTTVLRLMLSVYILSPPFNFISLRMHFLFWAIEQRKINVKLKSICHQNNNKRTICQSFSTFLKTDSFLHTHWSQFWMTSELLDTLQYWSLVEM